MINTEQRRSSNNVSISNTEPVVGDLLSALYDERFFVVLVSF